MRDRAEHAGPHRRARARRRARASSSTGLATRRARATPTSSWTKFDCTRSRSIGTPGCRPSPRRAGARAHGRRRGARRCGRARRGRPPRRSPPAASRRRSGASRSRARCISSARAGDQRAERAAEALREAQRDGVEEPPMLGGRRRPTRRTRSAAARRRGGLRSRARARSRRPRRSSSSGQTVPPARVVRVLERDDRRTRRVEARRRRASWPRSARATGGRGSPGSPRVCRPECRAAPPSSEIMMCAVSSTTSSVPRSPRIASAIWFPSSPSAGRRPPPARASAGDALLEREHRRVLALLLVADLGAHHRLAHPGRRLASACRSEGRSSDRNLTACSHPLTHSLVRIRPVDRRPRVASARPARRRSSPRSRS